MSSSRKYTLNFDGSHNNQANKAGAGCIIRDDNGNLIVAASYNLTKLLNQSYYNVAIAEAIGLRNGLELAQNNNLNLNYIKGDNKEVIDHVLGEHRRLPEPTLARIINEIKVLFGQGFAEIMLVNRIDNKVADKLASIGSSQRCYSMVYTRDHIIPTEVSELIEQERESNMSIARNDNSRQVDINLSNVALAAGLGMLMWGANEFFFGEASSPGFFSLQYFGSDRNQVHKARAGCIITNRGQFIIAGAYNLNHQYPDCHIAIAEAIALWNGLKLARVKNVRLDLIQGRNKEVRDRVLGLERRPARSSDLSEFIGKSRDFLRAQSINKGDVLTLVDEESIKVARALAIEGGRLEEVVTIYENARDLPLRVANLVD